MVLYIIIFSGFVRTPTSNILTLRKYHTDYNNNPPTSISFIPVVPSTSVRLHSEFVDLLFLQTHRETDRFFTGSGVHYAQVTSGHFHIHRVTFFSQLKGKPDLVLSKTTSFRITLNIDGTPIVSRSHSPITLSNLSSFNLVFVFRYSSSPHNLVYVRRVIPSVLAFSLS